MEDDKQTLTGDKNHKAMRKLPLPFIRRMRKL